MAEQEAAEALPHVTKPLRLVAFVAVCLLALIAGFSLGLLTRNPTQQALSATAKEIQVTAVVDHRPFGDNSLGTGSVTAGETVDAFPPSAAGVRQVVTVAGPAVRSVITAPAFLGAVNGQPMIAVHTAIPLYRDLNRNDTGPDVSALQAAFAVPATGKVTTALQSAVASVFKRAGFPLAPNAPIPAGEIMAVPSESFTVTSSVAAGELLSADSKMASLQISPNVVTVRVAINRIDSIQVGSPVTVTVGSDSLAAKVSTIGSFEEADPDKSASIAGHDVRVTLDDPTKAASLEPGASASVVSSTAAPQRLVVPAQGIRTAGDGGTYILLKHKSGLRRVAIRVISEVDGYVAISGKVVAGDRIVLN